MTQLRTSGLNLLLALAATLALAGCGDDPSTAPAPQPIDPLPPGTPRNDSPANTMLRFEAAYENQVVDEYGPLLTADFRFTFSNQSDPLLVSQYGDNWGKTHEVTSTSHLFEGFTNDQGEIVPGAAGITLTLSGLQIVTDPDHTDSTAHYRYVIVTPVSLLLDVPNTNGYEIAANHDFYLVRGDAAVLGAGQTADSTRWYVRRQVDKSPPMFVRSPTELAPARILPAQNSTWGAVKAQYFE